ncbi:SPOR domain-containing protein [Pseudomonas kuykendallii]|uniref:Sporulation protein n=1 Tax=Pseudomonas kuykendallii TaxID=1007099 RepID=A0A2W5CT58_9PSED|nr:SPOR domain-containing protein [Pseudomonas kuykendallii]PZP20574.1 MAG: sporulation protein [Pseudomonas kuykendallii]
MRWLFLLLLMLNLFYYVWHQQQAPLRVKEVAPLSLYRSAEDNIRLLSESGNVPAIQGRPAPVAPGGQVDDVCLFLGGYAGEADIQPLEQRLKGLDVSAQVQARDAEGAVDYWVYLPPLASRQASFRQLKELQSRHIDSYLIGEGDLADGISLGMFPRQELADALVRRLNEAGYEPQMRELPRAYRSFWLRVDDSSRRLLDDALLARLSTDFPGMRHQLMPCKDVASPR